MEKQKQQKERFGQHNDKHSNRGDDSPLNPVRQSRGQPVRTEQERLTESQTIEDNTNTMHSRKRRKKSPALLHYSSGHWRDEGHVIEFRQSQWRPELIENEYKTEII